MDKTDRANDSLDSLWEKLDDLKNLESDLTAHTPPASGETCPPRDVRTEIEERLGFLPPHFKPALGSPSLLESMWNQYVSSCLENPLPELFKEKLALRLSRHCRTPYLATLHACTLMAMGVPPADIKQLVAEPFENVPSNPELAREYLSAAQDLPGDWPEENRPFEECVMAGCETIFLRNDYSERWAREFKNSLGPGLYSYLTALIAYHKSSQLWVEAHPEISFRNHPAVKEHYSGLQQAEPEIAELLENHNGALKQRSNGIFHPDKGDNSQYREFFENASDIIYTYDFDGNIISINRAVERITGYTQSEMLRTRITDFIAPGFEHLGKKMLDIHAAGEVPLNYELEIQSKANKRIVLGISTRPVYRSGKPVAVQGIARDITERKKTEAELQKANRQLEAWVSELEERTREMTLLNELGDILRACLTTEEAYNVIVRHAQQIFPVRVGALYVIAQSRNLVEQAAVWGDASLAEHSFDPQECWALRRGRTHWMESNRSGLVCRHVHHAPSNGYLCIPMMAQSEALGILHLMQPHNIAMTETKQRMAVAMAEHIAMALSNLKLHETLRSQSIRDPLTGLFNRRFMEESLELEIRRAARNQRPLGMIMIDLDHFKHFNDNFGHDAGDLLLKELGSLLKNNIRAEDIACRYGGEEFTLILPEGTGAVTRQRAEFFKDAIQRLDVRYHNQPLGQMTASMGVAVFPDNGRNSQSLIEAADKALYRSKHAGRNCVTMA
jgi:diguanylate cyclase (GGDEF)-like protein/PAS domain S-box-containing protein